MGEGGDEGTRGWRNEAKHPVPLLTTHLMLRHLAAMLHGGVHGAAQHEGLGQAGVRLDVHAHLGRPVREVARPPEIAAPPGVDVDDLHGQARPGTAQYSLVWPSTAQYSPARYSQVQPGTARYSPVQPGPARYSPVQPRTARYSPVQPGTAQYNPVRPGTARPGPVRVLRCLATGARGHVPPPPPSWEGQGRGGVLCPPPSWEGRAWLMRLGD